ncbi:MAG: DUF4190 domain-containing protein [Anaerolineales bacterium]|nr:DUF4190 domain-containing protein [Anaerolineales bacterium]
MQQPDYASSQTSTMAIVSVISGVLSWFALPFIGAVVAIFTGHMARNEIKSNPGMQGDALALIGLILGYLHIITFCGALLLFLLFFGGIVGLSGCAILSEAGQSGASLSIPPIPLN